MKDILQALADQLRYKATKVEDYYLEDRLKQCAFNLEDTIELLTWMEQNK